MRKSFYCIDAHTCGNPVRLVAGGGPVLNGNNIAEKRLDFLDNHDWIRKGLMFEPRGHDMMSGSILYPASDPNNDIAILFIETSGCLPMCGHGTIGSVTIMIEEGIVEPVTPGSLRLETPAGIVKVQYAREANKVPSVRLINIPSFLFLEGIQVQCDRLGFLSIDIAYGGNFYAIIDPQKNFSGIQDYSASDLIALSPSIRKKLNEITDCVHPEHSEISGVTHILWTGDTISPLADARNAVFYGDKAIDRSPCGTGTSARMAQWHARGKLNKGDSFVHESIIGSTFTGVVEEITQCGSYPAIIPSIEGWAKITGYNHIIIDDQDDPFAHGFQVI